jgi:hypothetical protein
MQKIINKGLDLSEAIRRIKSNDKHRIKTAVSLITGFPEETKEDLRDTVSFVIDSLRFDHAQPQLHLLAPLAETPIQARYRDKLIFDDIFSDMSYQGWRQDPADRAMIKSHPDIFPNFYAVPTPWLDRQYLKELRDFILNGIQELRWLLVALHQRTGDLTRVFDEWRSWLSLRHDVGSECHHDSSLYYSKTEFRRDFLEFVRSCYLKDKNKGSLAVAALIEYEEHALATVRNSPPSGPDGPAPEAAEGPKTIGPDVIPHLAKGVSTVHLDADYKKIIQCLRRKGRLDRVPARPVVLVTRESQDMRTEVLQLSPLSARLLALCDGSRSVKQISDVFSSGGEIDGIPPDKACIFGLEMLRLQSLIVASPQPLAAGQLSSS